jgi:anti-sigma B factor antagonist
MRFSRNELGEKTVLRIEGSLDAVSTPEIRPVFDALVAEKRMAVTVDLSRLRQIDSSGVGAIVSLHKRIRGQGG